MAAYMIVFARIRDRARFLAEYARPTAELVARMGGEYVLRAPGVQALEGGLFEGASTVISRWPNRAALDAFYHSAEYAALREARGPLAEAYVLVAEDPPA